MLHVSRWARHSIRKEISASHRSFQPRLTPLEDRLAPAIFDVGYGLAYSSVGAVPWNNLTAGDTVNIHWRSSAQGGDYREKINISGQGTATNPIRVIGIPGPNGEKPVINGQNATTGAGSTTGAIGHQARGLIIFSRGNGNQNLNTYKPQHIIVDGLVVTGAKPANSFRNSAGSTVSFTSNAAAFYIERGQNITIRNCTITDSGNGIFAGSVDYYAEGGIIRDVLVEHNHIYGNGTANGFYEHNVYTEGVNFTYQYNRFEGLRATSTGSQLKDRSAGTVIRYNYFSGSGRLDLVNAQESASVLTTLPSYRDTYVYGNIMRDPPGATGAYIHYGGDDWLFDNYRKGTLHFYHNTIVIQENQSTASNTYLFRVDTNDETVDARNNIIYRGPATTGSTPTRLVLADVSDSAGIFNFGVNWVSSGWQTWAGGTTPTGGQMNGTANFINNTANDPGFVSLSSFDYHLLATAQPVDKGQALDASSAATNPLTKEYVYHQGWDTRSVQGAAADLGAFEYESAPAGTLQIRKGVASVDEAAGTVTLLVSRIGGSAGALTLQYATSNGTASSPGDYLATVGTLVWPAGNTRSQKIVVPIINDVLAEGNETFFVTISNPTGGATLGAITKGTVTILANDGGSGGRWIDLSTGESSGSSTPAGGDTGALTVAASTKSSGELLRLASPFYLAPTGGVTIASEPVATRAEVAESTVLDLTVWNPGAENLSQVYPTSVVVPSAIISHDTLNSPLDLETSLGLFDGVFVG